MNTPMNRKSTVEAIRVRFDAEVEREIGALVYEAFGLVEEISR